MAGVLALGLGTDALERTDLRDLCVLLVQAHSGYVFQADATKPDVFAALRLRCESAMALRAAEVAAAAHQDESILADVLRTVQERAPLNLKWAEAAGAGGAGCFEAETDDQHLYSVNLLTGAVLLDGSPPRSLPADVLSHPLYRRTFGNRDFEARWPSSRPGAHYVRGDSLIEHSEERETAKRSLHQTVNMRARMMVVACYSTRRAGTEHHLS